MEHILHTIAIAHNSRHHRLPRSRGGESDERNISFVERDNHRAWHKLFENKTAPEIADIINSVWLDPDFKFICVKAKYLDRLKQ